MEFVVVFIKALEQVKVLHDELDLLAIDPFKVIKDGNMVDDECNDRLAYIYFCIENTYMYFSYFDVFAFRFC